MELREIDFLLNYLADRLFVETSYTKTSYTKTSYTKTSYTKSSYTKTSYTKTSYTKTSYTKTSYTKTSYTKTSYTKTSCFNWNDLGRLEKQLFFSNSVDENILQLMQSAPRKNVLSDRQISCAYQLYRALQQQRRWTMKTSACRSNIFFFQGEKHFQSTLSQHLGRVSADPLLSYCVASDSCFATALSIAVEDLMYKPVICELSYKFLGIESSKCASVIFSSKIHAETFECHEQIPNATETFLNALLISGLI